MKFFDLPDFSPLLTGDIDLDFRGNHSLQHIQLHMINCGYYAFHQEPGKRWRNANEEPKGYDDSTTEQKKEPSIFYKSGLGHF